LELIPEIGYTSSLASSWSCSSSPCFSPFSPGIQVVDKTMYVSSGQLSPGLYVFRITVAHQILQISLTDEIYIHIMRYPMNEISAFIFSRTFGKISSDKMLSLDGSLSTANKNDPALLWYQVVGDNLFGMSDNSTYTNLDVSSIQVPFIAFSTQAMTPNQMFVFRLKASSPRGYSAFADISFLTNEPPSGGIFAVLPKIGTSLDTVFVLSMPLWYDEDLPLRFAFFIEDDETSDEIMLGSSFQPFILSVLPPMSKSVAILIGKVFDCFGSFSKMNESIIIKLPTITSTEFASNLVTRNVSKFLGVSI
jgi:hypothetical protein